VLSKDYGWYNPELNESMWDIINFIYILAYGSYFIVYKCDCEI